MLRRLLAAIIREDKGLSSARPKKTGRQFIGRSQSEILPHKEEEEEGEVDYLFQRSSEEKRTISLYLFDKDRTKGRSH